MRPSARLPFVLPALGLLCLAARAAAQPLVPSEVAVAADTSDAAGRDSAAFVASSDAPPRPLAARPFAARTVGYSGAAAPDTARRLHRGRLYAGLGAAAAANVAAVAALSSLWYEGERVPFHWYSEGEDVIDRGWLDDWHTEAQMDKGGHVLTSYHIARLAGEYGRWSGLSDRRAGLAGAVLSSVFQGQIELFDGRDRNYGASRTDLLANTVGAALGGAKIAFPEQTAAFNLKLSYAVSPYYDRSVSPFAPARLVGNVIKDYNGLTYWLAVKPSELGAPRGWPAWLGVAVGYAADSIAHPVSGLGPGGGPGPEHRRQVVLSLDADVLRHFRHRIPAWLRPVTMLLELYRLPAPAVEFTGGRVRLHALYF